MGAAARGSLESVNDFDRIHGFAISGQVHAEDHDAVNENLGSLVTNLRGMY